MKLVPTERHLDESPGRLFRDFVDDAAARLAPELTLATPHTTRLLARRALDELPASRLAFPEEPAARVALAHAVDRAIGRLRRAGTAPEHLRAAGSKQALLFADLLSHVDDLLAEARLADARSAGSVVARRLAGGARADLPELARGRVTVTGIAAFEPDDLAVLEALHGRLRREDGAGVVVELPRLVGALAHAPDDATSPVADDLERRWSTLDDAPDIAWVATRRGLPREVLAARDADGEARGVVSMILHALDRGAAPERIAVVVPDLEEPRLLPLRAALADARVPFAEPRGRPVAGCPEGRVVLALLAVAVGPVTREQVIELLRAPGLSPCPWTERSSGRDAEGRAALLAHRLREVPVEIDRHGGLLLDGLAAVVHGHPDEVWMPRTLDRLLRGARWIGEGGGARSGPSRREVARRLLALLERLELGRPRPTELAAALRSRERRGAGLASESTPALRALGEGAAAVRAVREAVRGLVEGAAAAGLAEAPSSVADFAAELTAAVSELGVGLFAASTAAGACAVHLGSPAELAGLSHDLVIVTGLEERAYSGAEGDLALLDDRVQRRLPLPCRPPSAGQREAWRRAELAWAMAGADQVHLTYALDDAGDPRSPHHLVRWAGEHGAASRKEPASRVARGASCIDARSAELVALAAGAPPRGDVADRASAERARTAFFLDPRAPAERFTGRVVITDEAMRRRLVAAVGGDTPERPVAVTAIERASACAFAGFARRVLRVRRVDDLVESADARERGTLVHRALQAAFESLRDTGMTGDPAVILAAARAAAEKTLGLSAVMAPLRREAVMHAVSDAVGVVIRYLESEDPLSFLVAEKSFGNREPGAWPALAVAGEEGGELVYIDGQIDRVDAAPGRARVVDYKTGKIPTADEHGKSAFQLPLYAAVVARALGCADVSAHYLSVRPRGVVEEWPRALEDRRGLGNRREEIAKAARRVVLGLWQGEAAPRPAKATTCTRCDARDICRRPAVAPIEESEGAQSRDREGAETQSRHPGAR